MIFETWFGLRFRELRNADQWACRAHQAIKIFSRIKATLCPAGRSEEVPDGLKLGVKFGN